MKNIFFLFLAVIMLNGCTETKFLAHLVKQVPMPSDLPKSKGSFKVGSPYKIKGRTYYPEERYNYVEKGIASWYGPNFHGKLTANGEVYNQYELTAAHKTLQMPSIIRVTNLENGRSLILRVNDRGPYSRNRILDVSKRAAELLGFKKQGTARIKLQVLEKESKIVAQAAKEGRDTSGMEVAFNNKRYPIQQTKIANKSPTNISPKFNKYPTKITSIEKESLPASQQLSKTDIAEINIAKTAIVPTKIYVQAGSFSNHENALRLASELSSVGTSNIYPTMVNNRQFYRVRVGPLDSVELADNILNRLVDNGNSQAMIIIEEM